MTAAIVIFSFSLLGIGALFAFKRWEMGRGTLIAPAFRSRADVEAEKLKELAYAAWLDLGKVPPEALRTARVMVRELALALAALARFAEAQAHRLADFVSHKHGFERRETRSEFLRKVAEHKNGGETSEPRTRSTELDESSN